VTAGAVLIFGDGGQTRDFIYVADVVVALRAAMRLRAVDAPVFNVCSGVPTSVMQLAHTIGSLTRGVPVLRHAPPRAGEIRDSLGDPVRGRVALGLDEPTSLEDGLRFVLAWMAARQRTTAC
jgi:UDP-glucose 4-epimerase